MQVTLITRRSAFAVLCRRARFPQLVPLSPLAPVRLLETSRRNFASPPKSRFRLVNFIREEVANLAEELEKESGVRRRKGARDLQKFLERYKDGYTPPPVQTMTSEPAAEPEGGWLPPVIVDNRTVWEKRMDSLRDVFGRAKPSRVVDQVSGNLAKSENPALSAIRSAKEKLDNKVDDLRTEWETSQHPLVYKFRDLSDSAFGESETGWALNELKQMDPGFTLDDFLAEMEEYMIPAIVEAFLRGDASFLRTVTEEHASRFVFASLREREVQGHYWDHRILDIDRVDFAGATVRNNIPLLTLSFRCQHVRCVRNNKREIVEGSEADIADVYYQWVLRRDFENPLFSWKIVEMTFHRVLQLI